MRRRKLVLGCAELTVLDLLKLSMPKRDIIRRLLARGRVNAAAAGSEAIDSLVKKRMAKSSDTKVELTPAGKLLRKALVQARLM